MSNIALSRLERDYVAVQSTFNQVPTFTNTNYLRAIKVDLKNEISTLVRRDKTGTRSAVQGIRGRGFGTWSYNGSLAPSGVNGTIPDFDPIFQALFGQASISAGGGLTYAFTDTPILTFGMASYRTPSTLNQKIAYGCVVNKATFNLGADIAEWSAEGEARFVLQSDYFVDASTDEKGGLGSFPAEPGAPVSHGGIIAGFTGLISIGGNTMARIRTATVEVVTGNQLIKDTFSVYIPDDTEGDIRMVTLAATMYEDDSASQEALRVAAITKTPVNASLTLGTVAGSIVDFELVNVQLASPASDDSGLRYSLNFPASRAFGTSITTLDELKIIIK